MSFLRVRHLSMFHKNQKIWTIIEDEVQPATIIDSYPIYVEDIGTCYKLNWNGRELYKCWKYIFCLEHEAKMFLYKIKLKRIEYRI